MYLLECHVTEAVLFVSQIMKLQARLTLQLKGNGQ